MDLNGFEADSGRSKGGSGPAQAPFRPTSIGLVMCQYSHTPAVPVAVRVNGSLGEVRLVQSGRP